MKIKLLYVIIYIRLRSNREGHYPELMKFAEERLRELNPHSQLLVKENKKVVTKDLPSEEREKLHNDIEVKYKQTRVVYYNYVHVHHSGNLVTVNTVKMKHLLK